MPTNQTNRRKSFLAKLLPTKKSSKKYNVNDKKTGNNNEPASQLSLLLDGTNRNHRVKLSAIAIADYSSANFDDVCVRRGEPLVAYFKLGKRVCVENTRHEIGFLPLKCCGPMQNGVVLKAVGEKTLKASNREKFIRIERKDSNHVGKTNITRQRSSSTVLQEGRKTTSTQHQLVTAYQWRQDSSQDVDSSDSSDDDDDATLSSGNKYGIEGRISLDIQLHGQKLQRNTWKRHSWMGGDATYSHGGRYLRPAAYNNTARRLSDQSVARDLSSTSYSDIHDATRVQVHPPITAKFAQVRRIASSTGCLLLDTVPLVKDTIKLTSSKAISPRDEGVVSDEDVYPSDAISDANCHGKMAVAYDYISIDERDLNVLAGQRVQVVRTGRRDWVWVKNEEGHEGFVPRNYLVQCDTADLSEIEEDELSQEKLDRKPHIDLNSHTSDRNFHPDEHHEKSDRKLHIDSNAHTSNRNFQLNEHHEKSDCVIGLDDKHDRNLNVDVKSDRKSLLEIKDIFLAASEETPETKDTDSFLDDTIVGGLLIDEKTNITEQATKSPLPLPSYDEAVATLDSRTENYTTWIVKSSHITQNRPTEEQGDDVVPRRGGERRSRPVQRRESLPARKTARKRVRFHSQDRLHDTVVTVHRYETEHDNDDDDNTSEFEAGNGLYDDRANSLEPGTWC